MWDSNMLLSVSISPKTLQASNMEEAICLLQTVGPGIDIAELCGGVARATTLAVRRSLRAGPNFDLITGVDLNNRKDQELTKKYIDKHHVLVVVMAPTCGPFGRMGRFVKYVTLDAWQRSYDHAAHMANSVKSLRKCNSGKACTSYVNSPQALTRTMNIHGLLC